MAYKNRYFKNPVGRNDNYSFIAFAGQVEYTAQLTYELFVLNSVPGEIGVFNAVTGGAMSGIAAASTTIPLFIAANKGPAYGTSTPNKISRSEDFIIADSKITRTPYVAPVKGTVTFVFDAATAVVANDELGIKVLDLTPAGNPMSSFDFRVKVVGAETFDAAMARLVAIINDTAGVLLKDRDPLVTATYTAGTNTLLISNVDFGVVSKVLLQDKLATATLTSTTVVKTVLGSGYVDEAILFQEAMWIRDGVTTNYPDGGANPADFGMPTSLITPSTIQFNHYTFQVLKTDTSKIPHKLQWNPTSFELLVASNGAANAEAEIKVIFGL